VNVLAATVEVVVSMSETGGLKVGPTKTGKRRTITVPRFLARLLEKHIDRYPSPDGWLFTAREGGPVSHHNFRRRHFQPACVAAGLGVVTKEKNGPRRYEGVRFHDLRHTCASLLIAAGRSLQEVKDHLGHSSIRVTSDRYAHLYPEARAAMADALENTFLATLADFSRTTAMETPPAGGTPKRRDFADLEELLERTTGFEPATPTLAILSSLSRRRSHLGRAGRVNSCIHLRTLDSRATSRHRTRSANRSCLLLPHC
jgi:hypothetical protein